MVTGHYTHRIAPYGGEQENYLEEDLVDDPLSFLEEGNSTTNTTTTTATNTAAATTTATAKQEAAMANETNATNDTKNTTNTTINLTRRIGAWTLVFPARAKENKTVLHNSTTVRHDKWYDLLRRDNMA